MKIPCKNCITLAICKNEASREESLLYLTRKCKMFSRHWDKVNPSKAFITSNDELIKLNETRLFFGFQPIYKTNNLYRGD